MVLYIDLKHNEAGWRLYDSMHWVGNSLGDVMVLYYPLDHWIQTPVEFEANY